MTGWQVLGLPGAASFVWLQTRILGPAGFTQPSSIPWGEVGGLRIGEQEGCRLFIIHPGAYFNAFLKLHR